jgi:hypothetical protein
VWAILLDPSVLPGYGQEQELIMNPNHAADAIGVAVRFSKPATAGPRSSRKTGSRSSTTTSLTTSSSRCSNSTTSTADRPPIGALATLRAGPGRGDDGHDIGCPGEGSGEVGGLQNTATNLTAAIGRERLLIDTGRCALSALQRGTHRFLPPDRVSIRASVRGLRRQVRRCCGGDRSI